MRNAHDSLSGPRHTRPHRLAARFGAAGRGCGCAAHFCLDGPFARRTQRQAHRLIYRTDHVTGAALWLDASAPDQNLREYRCRHGFRPLQQRGDRRFACRCVSDCATNARGHVSRHDDRLPHGVRSDHDATALGGRLGDMGHRRRIGLRLSASGTRRVSRITSVSQHIPHIVPAFRHLSLVDPGAFGSDPFSHMRSQ